MSTGVLEKLSDLALRHLDEPRRKALRRYYLAAQERLAPLTRWVYGSFDAEALGRHLREQMGSNYEILMVHSSLNHMRPMFTGTPMDLLGMLMDFCGPDRTLAMPAFFFGDPAIGGAYDTFERRPTFDVLRTPSQMGMLTELFRRTKGICLSRHPVYRIAALGPLAKELTRGHESAGTPCGSGTPFDFMAHRNTLILGIGKPFEVLTQVHHPEDVMGDDFPVPARRRERSLTVNLVEGANVIPFQMSGRSFEWRRNMWLLRGIMNRETLKEWSFHHMPPFATRAADVSSAIMDAAKRGLTIYEQT